MSASPLKYQRILLKLSGEALMGEVDYGIDPEVISALAAEIVEVDKASFEAVMGPVYDKFMTTPDMKRLVKAVQDSK